MIAWMQHDNVTCNKEDENTAYKYLKLFLLFPSDLVLSYDTQLASCPKDCLSDQTEAAWSEAEAVTC